jgi:hypothetical protein
MVFSKYIRKFLSNPPSVQTPLKTLKRHLYTTTTLIPIDMTIAMQSDQNIPSQPPRRAPRYRKHRTLISHLKGVTCLKYSPCGRYLASAGESSVSAGFSTGYSWERSCSGRSGWGSTPMASRVSHHNERTSSLTRFTSSYRSNCLGMQIPGNMYGRTEVMIEVSLDFQL